LVNELQLDKRSLQERIERMRFGEILGSSPAMQEVFRKVERVAGTDITCWSPAKPAAARS